MNRRHAAATLLALAAGKASDDRKSSRVRLLLAGDVMLARRVRLAAQTRKDPGWPFRRIAARFAAADLAFVNLESPFAETPPYFEERMVFRAHPEMVEGLKLAGIDIVSTANNHARDAGGRGIEFTLDLLAKNGIAAVGTAVDPAHTRNGVVMERNGVRFGFLAYTFDQRNGNHKADDPRVAMMDPASVAIDVENLRRQAGVVIVSMHAGAEYQTRLHPTQVRFARAAIDAGAAIVAGHHPHVVQAVERHGPGVILYSLGNLVFDHSDPAAVRKGAVAEVDFLNGRLDQVALLEVEIADGAPQFLSTRRLIQ
jgi:poly-gamma-glutamate synthesis protein (capsule biosynthesis protein)